MEIRPANPADWQEAVPLIYSSGAEAFDYTFSYPGFCTAQDYLRYAFQEPQGQYSYNQHWVVQDADDADKVIAIFLCSDLEKINELQWPNIRSVMSFFTWRSMGIAKRATVVEQVMPLPKPELLLLANIAVLPEYRGQGCGRQIIQYAEQYAKSLGKQGLALHVAEENEGAQGFYQRLGFEKRALHSSPDKNMPGHWQMEYCFV